MAKRWIRWRTDIPGRGPEPVNLVRHRVKGVIPGQPYECDEERAAELMAAYFYEEDACPGCGGSSLLPVSPERPPTPTEAVPLLERGVDPWECLRCPCGCMAPLSEVRRRVSCFEDVPEEEWPPLPTGQARVVRDLLEQAERARRGELSADQIVTLWTQMSGLAGMAPNEFTHRVTAGVELMGRLREESLASPSDAPPEPAPVAEPEKPARRRKSEE